ncbi:MAG: DegQ family serine endoprotease [Herminiimonas sp.]|nr:DegQ family serine endoprotease [Herminiimonas sp.]
MNRKNLVRSAIATAVVVLTLGGVAHYENPQWGLAHAAVAPEQNTNPPQAVATTVPGLATATDFSGIVERYGPAVVNISVVSKAERTPTAGREQGEGDDESDPFSQLFPDFGQRRFRPGPAPLVRGLGSGFIISPDGLILTNAHVVAGAQEVTVKLTDRREFKAKVLGFDKQSDIAVIRIPATNLPTVRIGDPAKVKVGEPVLAIGSPYGFENTATAGIVSATSRSLPDETYVPFIQTDVAVNPGNSGGPLFNLRGEVIGINSQIYSRTGGYQGLSFSIPIDVATRVQQQLVAHGKVSRGRLGVSVQDVTQALANSFGLKTVAGALVGSVETGSPADKAGLKTGDVIVGINGKKVDRSSDLPAQVATMPPGTSTKLDVIRGGASQSLSVTLGESKEAQVARNDQGGADEGRLGLAVRPLAREEQKQIGTNGGLLVENASGAAARSGIQPGDILLAINGTPITSVDQLRTMAQKAGKNIALLVQRESAKIFVPIDLG